MDNNEHQNENGNNQEEQTPKKKMGQVKVIIAILGFVVLLVGAMLIYRSLSQKYLNSNEVKTEEEKTDTTDTEDKDTGKNEGTNDVDEDDAQDTIKPETTEITLIDAEGNEVRISDRLGKPTIVNFWASWCPYCIEEMPYFQTVYDEKGEDVNFMMVNVTDGSRETVEIGTEFIKTKGFTFPIYFDTKLEASTFYNIYALPTTVFLDKDGQEVGRVSGKMSEEDLRLQIEKLME